MSWTWERGHGERLPVALPLFKPENPHSTIEMARSIAMSNTNDPHPSIGYEFLLLWKNATFLIYEIEMPNILNRQTVV
ncbi:hypothetical protein HJC23_013566 [Cyclotella cryptica]|uniref:Uncharacterized protein n=1 Tax=Cyclotella cryptica TaxID=29204 RepID=A0ABD3PBU9_9STRA